MKRRPVSADDGKDRAHVQPRPVFKLGELSESPGRVAPRVVTGRKSPTQLSELDSVGVVNVDHLIKQFRVCMSDLMESHMARVVGSIASIREGMSSVRNSLHGFDSRLTILE
eukprot:scpid42237/ scgid21467/ 